MTPYHFPLTPDWLFWQYPWLLAGLLLLVPLWWWWLRPYRRGVIRYSDTTVLTRIGARPGLGARSILPILLSGAIAALFIACARPQRADTTSYEYAEGIAIQLVVDTSGSMAWMKPTEGRRPRTTLEIVKEVMQQFVLGDGEDLPGRPNDLIGLIQFGTWADSLVPLTLDHQSLTETIANLQPQSGEDAGTAIGEGLALAVERMKDLKRISGSGDQYEVTSRIIVLLTDGQDDGRFLDPVEAGKLAANFNLRVYTILAPPSAVMIDPATGRAFRTQRVDDSALREIADMTGGAFFQADDAESLRNIYEKIDELERTKTEERRFERYGELSWPLLAAAFICLALHALLDATILRKTP